MTRWHVLALAAGLAAALALAAEKEAPKDEASRIAALCKQLGETEYGSKGACEQLVQIGKPAMPGLLAALKDKRPQARWWAVAAVCNIGADEGYTAILDVLRTDSDSFVRSTAVYYLRHFRNKGKDIWPVVEEALADKNPDVGRWALRLMVEDSYPKADEAVRKILASGSAELRGYALEHIRQMREGDAARAKAFLPLVRQLLSSPDPRTRCNAIHSAVALMDSGQLDFLRETFQKDPDPLAKEIALRCVTVIPSPPVEAIDLFILGLESEDEKVRDAADKLICKGCKQYFGYGAKQPLPIRQAAVGKWKKWYAENKAKLKWEPDLRKFLLPGEREKLRNPPGTPAAPEKKAEK